MYKAAELNKVDRDNLLETYLYGYREGLEKEAAISFLYNGPFRCIPEHLHDLEKVACAMEGIEALPNYEFDKIAQRILGENYDDSIKIASNKYELVYDAGMEKVALIGAKILELGGRLGGGLTRTVGRGARAAGWGIRKVPGLGRTGRSLQDWGQKATRTGYGISADASKTFGRELSDAATRVSDSAKGLGWDVAYAEGMGKPGVRRLTRLETKLTGRAKELEDAAAAAKDRAARIEGGRLTDGTGVEGALERLAPKEKALGHLRHAKGDTLSKTVRKGTSSGVPAGTVGATGTAGTVGATGTAGTVGATGTAGTAGTVSKGKVVDETSPKPKTDVVDEGKVVDETSPNPKDKNIPDDKKKKHNKSMGEWWSGLQDWEKAMLMGGGTLAGTAIGSKAME